MLFHVTISHSPRDCPGRHPNDVPELIAPSDTRDTLARELGITPHFVFWGASCIMWAQPEHVAYAVLEADDLESVLQYIGSLIPPGWSSSAIPVWNLPAQLRLVRQVRLATPLTLGESIRLPDPTESVPPAPALEPPVRKATHATESDSPGTITRMLRELDDANTESHQRSTPTTSDDKGSARVENPQTSTTFIGEPETPNQLARVPALRLEVTGGPSAGKTFVVDETGAILGRLPECSVYVPDERLSRQHAAVEFRQGGYWLKDLNSRNGTAVNGTILSAPQLLHNGDSIELGASLLVVKMDAAPQS